MNTIEQIEIEPGIESESMNDFARVMQTNAISAAPVAGGELVRANRLNLRQGDVKNGLGQLVLTIVRLLHELLEKQAIRRIEAGSLTEDEIERLGQTLMTQAQEIERLRKEFHLEERDLNLDLGPLGKLLSERS